jgi:hypothetical protein
MAKTYIQAIAAIGRELYGERWQRSASRDLGVHDVTVGRWLRGIGAPTIDDLQRMLAATRHKIDRLFALHDDATDASRLAPGQPTPVQPQPAQTDLRPGAPWWELKARRQALRNVR